MNHDETRQRPLDDHLAIHPEELEWKTLQEGIRYATVLKDPERDFSVMFLEFQPGARAVRHVHPGGEQYWIIRGTIEDENGTHGAGTYVIQPPGSEHTPMSPDGALVLVSWFGTLREYEE